MSKLGSQDTEIQGFGGSGHQTKDAEGLQGFRREHVFPKTVKNIVETFCFWIRFSVVKISTLFQLNLYY